MGRAMATNYANAHEKKLDNKKFYLALTTMDLHNNAIGLSITQPIGMNDFDFALYTYEIVRSDGYWLIPTEYIPEGWINE